MHLSKINEALDHKITGGGDYGWNCYGFNNWSIDYSSDYAHGYVVFSVGTGLVYEVSVAPNVDELLGKVVKPYRYIDPAYRDAYDQEAKMRFVDPNVAWDDVKWVDLETEEDFLEKATAIFNGQPFDERIIVPIDLDDETLLQLSRAAHERDITLNKMIELALQDTIDNYQEIK